MYVSPVTETTSCPQQSSAASSVTNPEMLVLSMTAHNKDYFPSSLVARDQVIKFGLISLCGV